MVLVASCNYDKTEMLARIDPYRTHSISRHLPLTNPRVPRATALGLLSTLYRKKVCPVWEDTYPTSIP